MQTLLMLKQVEIRCSNVQMRVHCDHHWLAGLPSGKGESSSIRVAEGVGRWHNQGIELTRSEHEVVRLRIVTCHYHVQGVTSCSTRSEGASTETSISRV